MKRSTLGWVVEKGAQNLSRADWEAGLCHQAVKSLGNDTVVIARQIHQTGILQEGSQLRFFPSGDLCTKGM